MTIEKPLKITISYDDGLITVANNIQIKKVPKENATGNGLAMLFERYNILNEDPPLILKDDAFFRIQLKVIAP